MFSSTSVLLIVSVLVYCFYKYLTKYYNYWVGQGIPFKKPVILFGNYKNFFFFRQSVGKIFEGIYYEFPDDKFVGCFKPRTPQLLIRDPDMIKQVLVKDFSTFSERFLDVSDTEEKLNSNLFFVHGDKWKAMRQKFTPAFTSGKLKNMFHLIVEKGEEFQNFLGGVIQNDNEQEVKDLMARFTTDVIGSVAFGIKLNSMEDKNAPFRKFGNQFFASSTRKTVKSFLRLFSPRLFNLLKLRIQDINLENFFIATVKEIIAERKQSQIVRHDFIDLLMELKEKGFIKNASGGTTDIEFTDAFMTAQAFIFFAAGFETSSTLMSFTLYELAKNPEVKQKALLEIDTVLKKHNGKISYDAIKDMHYLECCISEAMRKYPALGVLSRVSNSRYTFPDTKVTLEKGFSVVVPVFALHYDPKYYPEPEKFIPERFTPEAIQERNPMVYLPFGEGPRNCIGLRFGKMQSMVGLVSLLSKFTVEPSAKTEEKTVFNPMSFVTSPKNGIWLKITPRNTTT